MTISSIPLQATSNQQLRATLNGQQCIIELNDTPFGLFFSLNSNGVNIVNSVLGYNKTLLIAATYTNFIGNLMFNDTQGSSDPTWQGLGTQYELLYLDANAVAQFQVNN